MSLPLLQNGGSSQRGSAASAPLDQQRLDFTSILAEKYHVEPSLRVEAILMIACLESNTWRPHLRDSLDFHDRLLHSAQLRCVRFCQLVAESDIGFLAEETFLSNQWWRDWYEDMPFVEGDTFRGGTEMEAVLLWSLEYISKLSPTLSYH